MLELDSRFTQPMDHFKRVVYERIFHFHFLAPSMPPILSKEHDLWMHHHHHHFSSLPLLNYEEREKESSRGPHAVGIRERGISSTLFISPVILASFHPQSFESGGLHWASVTSSTGSPEKVCKT